MEKTKVYICFDHNNDAIIRKMMMSWRAVTDLDFSVNDFNAEEFQNKSIRAIKKELAKRISAATHTVVIIGKHSNTPHRDLCKIGYTNWLNYQIAKSKEYGHRIIGVKLDNSYATPIELINAGMKRASFNKDSIISALMSY